MMEFDRLIASIVFATAFRLIPVVCYSLFSKRVDWGTKLSLTLFVVGVVSLLARHDPTILHAFGSASLAYVGWTICCLVGIEARQIGGTRRAVRLAVAAFFAILWMAIPSIVRANELKLGLTMVAVDRALALFSALMAPTRPERGEAAFFVLVDPVMSFGARSRFVADPRATLHDVLRMGAGMLALSAATLSDVVPLEHAIEHRVLAFWVRAVRVGLTIYAAHWGVASVQIAAARMLGLSPPERYPKPLASRSPREFWTRWNTYMNQWLRDHVYVPARERLSSSIDGKFARPIAMLVVFAVSGLVHVVVAGLSHGQWSATLFAFFLGSAVLATAWDQAIAAIERIRPGATTGAFGHRMCNLTFLTVMFAAVSVGYAS